MDRLDAACSKRPRLGRSRQTALPDAGACRSSLLQYRDERPLPRAPTGKLPPLPAGPVPPPKKEDIERLLTRCQKKDIHNMFKEPVTEAIVSRCRPCWLAPHLPLLMGGPALPLLMGGPAPALSCH